MSTSERDVKREQTAGKKEKRRRISGAFSLFS